MLLNRRAFIKKSALTAAAFGTARIGSAARPATASLTGDELVRLLIDADREPLLELLVTRIKKGLDYPSLLGAVADASARQVRPYPHVGFKYHAFMVLHSVHRTTLLGRPEDRWLSILWSADVLKGSQAAEQRSGSWTLGPVAEHLVPGADKAETAFRKAMERWDPEAADAAVVGLLRSMGRERIFDLLFRYGARDFRAIGHKAITVANCHRLLGVVGAEHAEPMLRSLILALLNHKGEPNPADIDLAPDRPWRQNLVMAEQAPTPVPAKGEGGGGAVAGLLEVLREGTADDASRAVLASSAQGADDADLWTAIFSAAGDLMVKQSKIVSVHANTTAQALHYAYRHASDLGTRRMILLQAASFMPLFCDLLGGNRRSLGIETLEASDLNVDSSSALEDIFETINVDRVDAARKTFGYLSAGGNELSFMQLARHYVVDRNLGYHDYKLAESAFENAAALESPWRERYLASSVLYLKGSADKPNEVVGRARALLA